MKGVNTGLLMNGCFGIVCVGGWAWVFLGFVRGVGRIASGQFKSERTSSGGDQMDEPSAEM